MNDKIDVAVDYDITNGNVEKAYLVLNGVLNVDGLKLTFTNFRAPLDGGITLEDAGE